jgi:electron transfer flavoprotein beta subunit
MRILALVRQVPDAEQSLRIRNGIVDLEDNKLVLDTMDEYGVEEALRLRDNGAEVEIVVLAIGPKRTEDALRSALAMGADRAIHIETDTILDVIALSDVIARLAKTEQAELILCGGQQSDWDSCALGAAIAERLHWPQATWTTALVLNGKTLVGQHDVDDGNESFEFSLPAVITTQQGLNEPRYPTLPNVIKSRKKEIRKESLHAFDNNTVKVRVIGAEIQARQRLNKILDGKDVIAAALQLVQSLRNEAKVIS